MATTNYTGYTSSKEPATVTTLPAPVVEAQKMGTVQNPPIPVPVVPPFNYAQTIGQVGGYTQSAFDQEAQLAEQQAQMAQEALRAQTTDYAQAQAQLGQRATDTANIYNTQGVTQLAGQLRGLNAQALALQNESLAAPIATTEANRLAGRVTTTGVASGQTEALLRQNALKALSLGQQAAIAKADYDTAKSYADQIVDAKYEQLEANLNSRKTQIDWALKLDLEPTQRKAAETLARKYKMQEQEYAEQKATEKEMNNLIVEAAQFAPKDVLDRAQAIKDKGGSSTDVAIALGQYGKDFLKNQLLKEQLKTEQAQRAKIYADMNAKGATGTVGQITTATDIQNATANLKLTEAQSKALAFGQRAINADKAMQERLKIYDPTTIFSATGRLLNTDNARLFQRDLSDFITAVLRKESGATITEDEFDRFIPLYSPQGIMTNQADVAQTNLKRQGAIDALISEAGPASAVLSSYKNSIGQGQFVSTGNQLADEYVRNSMKTVNNVNTSMSTPNAMNAGYVDNQK